MKLASNAKPSSAPLPSPGGSAAWLVGAGVLAGALVVGLLLGGRSPGSTSVVPAASGGPGNAAELALGRERSRQACASCHLYPEPGLLDRVTWSMEVLPAMADWLGMHPDGTSTLVLDDRVKAAKLFPDSPAMSIEEWRAICAYYLAQAPDALTPPERPPLQVGMKRFVVGAKLQQRSGTATLLKIDPASGWIYLGESRSNSLVVFNREGQVETEVGFSSPPVDLSIRDQGLVLTLLGSYAPSDALNAKVFALGNPRLGQRGIKELLGALPRATRGLPLDVNRDGREDLVVCGYGNLLGRVSWFEARPDGRYQEHVVLDRSGAVTVEAGDFNGDGWPDLVLLMAQAREGIYLCLNQGGREFVVTPVVEQPPAWGYSALELVDFNRDGHLDLVVCNGDNGDHANHLPPMKPYHGVRLYLNDGRGRFAEARFWPLNGAYRTRCRDFDGDGDTDLAVISFYPDYRRAPREGFVYLENLGRDQYAWSTFEESITGRWITMDSGDLDGDGDEDLVLASHHNGPTFVPALLEQKWRQEGSCLLILRNTTR